MNLPSWLAPQRATNHSEAAAALLAEMQGWAAQGKVIGGVGLIAREGRTTFREAFGLRDRESDAPAETGTIFALSSLTKPFTSAAAMTLADQGKLSIEDPVQQYIPAFAAQRLWDGSAPAEPMRIRHLLTHSSGVIDAIPEWFLGTDYSLSELAEIAAAQPLAFAPGARWSYSNLGFDIVGRIVEIVSGRPYAQAVHDRILGPLGVRDSFLTVPRSRLDRIAAAYAFTDGQFVREGVRAESNPRLVSPSSGLYSTAGDLARFWQMLLNKGSYGGVRVLSPRSARAMVTSYTGSWNAGFLRGCGYGLGCSVITQPAGVFADYPAGTFGHGGFFQTHAWAVPEANLVCIILCQHRCPQPISDEVAEFISRAPAIM